MSSSTLPRWLIGLLFLLITLAVVAFAAYYAFFWDGVGVAPGAPPTPVSRFATGAEIVTVEAAAPADATPAPEAAPPTPTMPSIVAAPAPRSISYDLPPQPADGSVIDLPAEPRRVGWISMGDDDSGAASFPDFIIYAGSQDGLHYQGAAGFDLPPFDAHGLTESAELLLFGLSEPLPNPDTTDVWTVELLESRDDFWSNPTFESLSTSSVRTTLARLGPAELGPGQIVRIPFDELGVAYLNALRYQGRSATIRVSGPDDDGTLFGFDGGVGAGSLGNPPRLLLANGPVRPTPAPIIVTATPTPENVLTADAQSARARLNAILTGTPTPTPFIVFTATPGPQGGPEMVMIDGTMVPIVIPTATPGNSATAEALERIEAAKRRTTGTPTPLPERYVTATPTQTPIYLIATPTPLNAATRVAELVAATAIVAREGPATPIPDGYVVVTPTPAFLVVTNTPVPGNAATAQALYAQSTLEAFLTGTPAAPIVTATPTPPPDTPTPVPLVINETEITPTPTPSATATPPSVMPAEFRNKILFLSDRAGGEQLHSLDPVTGDVFRITQRWPYDLAREQMVLSPDGQQQAIVAPDQNRVLQIQIYSPEYGDTRQISSFNNARSYDPAWSPTGDRIAFVSTEAGNDEIYTIRPDGSELRRLTSNSWEWDKHPSWAPDGGQIVFWSNRESGRSQIWIMGADGSSPRNLSNNEYNDWAPIWVP